MDAKSLVEAIHYWEPVVGVALGVVLPAIFWASRVDSNIIDIKDNHLKHIQEASEKTNDLLLQILTILQERR